MIKPFPLQPLFNLAQKKTEDATRKLGVLNQQQLSAQAKLDALLQYRREYQTKFQEAQRDGMSPVDMRNFQDFMNRLDQAIQQQSAAIEKAKVSFNHGRDELLSSTRKMKSFDTLAQRHTQSEVQREAKNEQRQQDETTGRFAAFRFAKKEDNH